MSVLINGMEMSKSCFECPFMLHRCFCLVNPRIEFTDEEYSELKGRYSGCPLVPVPPHGRLIDADVMESALQQEMGKKRYSSVYDCGIKDGILLAIDICEVAPTVIEEECE